LAYVGWELDHQDRDTLLGMIAPAYPDVIAHHVTLHMGEGALPVETEGQVVGFADDGHGVQALVVEIAGTTNRPGGGTYHITWSIDRAAGRKPVDSNHVIADKGVIPFSVKWPIKLTPKLFQ
jgi:hypothetical protein